MATPPPTPPTPPNSPDPSASLRDATEGKPVLTVGWRERVAFPGWGIRNLKAKIDTGARTSALHVSTIEETPGDDDHIRFEVVVREARSGRSRLTRWVVAERVREAVVKPSSGQRQRRPVVRTRMKLAGRVTPIEVTLVCREGMLCRMLVGRTALVAGGYRVDPAGSFVHGNRTAKLVDPPA